MRNFFTKKSFVAVVIPAIMLGFSSCTETPSTSEPTPQPTTEYNSESWKTVITESCRSFNDGCNECVRGESGSIACTKKLCETYSEPICKDTIEVIPTDNSETSLDYEGTYTGVLPTADGAGMDVSITLNNGEYVKTTEYIGHDDVYTDSGTYIWSPDGTTITLSGVEDAPNKYFVGENTLTELDLDGNPIPADATYNSILTK